MPGKDVEILPQNRRREGSCDGKVLEGGGSTERARAPAASTRRSGDAWAGGLIPEGPRRSRPTWNWNTNGPEDGLEDGLETRRRRRRRRRNTSRLCAASGVKRGRFGLKEF